MKRQKIDIDLSKIIIKKLGQFAHHPCSAQILFDVYYNYSYADWESGYQESPFIVMTAQDYCKL